MWLHLIGWGVLAFASSRNPRWVKSMNGVRLLAVGGGEETVGMACM
uniref:Uncharacterized protein n=1 Tax=Arundo donax TaxID=35708 RepID=A0A0A8Z3W5_ARUDO